MQHTVVRLPVFPPQSLPEARRLHALVTLMDGHLTAAVEPRLQRTPERQKPDSVHALMTEQHLENSRPVDSLFFDLERGRVAHAAGVQLRLAAVPQVDDGLVDVEQDHGGSGAQAAAVTRHLQQVALHRHLATHAVQTPLTWAVIINQC